MIKDSVHRSLAEYGSVYQQDEGVLRVRIDNDKDNIIGELGEFCRIVEDEEYIDGDLIGKSDGYPLFELTYNGPEDIFVEEWLFFDDRTSEVFNDEEYEAFTFKQSESGTCVIFRLNGEIKTIDVSYSTYEEMVDAATEARSKDEFIEKMEDEIGSVALTEIKGKIEFDWD